MADEADGVTLPGAPFTSGDWRVKPGNERAFVELWRQLAECSMQSPGAHSFTLIRDLAEPRHFVSFGRWADADSITVLRSHPRFLELFRQCQALCETFGGSDFQVSVAVGADPHEEPYGR